MEIADEMRLVWLSGTVERSQQPWDELRHTRFSSLKQTLGCRGQAGRSPSLLIICGGAVQLRVYRAAGHAGYIPPPG